MTGVRSYTTKIWRQPSSIGFSSADALSTSMDPPGEPVISTQKRPCQKIQNGSEFPELVAQNFRNPHMVLQAFPAPKVTLSRLWLRGHFKRGLTFSRFSFDFPVICGTLSSVENCIWSAGACTAFSFQTGNSARCQPKTTKIASFRINDLRNAFSVTLLF